MSSICAIFGTGIVGGLYDLLTNGDCMKQWSAFGAKYLGLIMVILLYGSVLSAQPDLRVKLKDSTRVAPASPADTIQYSLQITNAGTGKVDSIKINRKGDPNTTYVAGSFQSTPVAVPDSALNVLEDQTKVVDLQGVDPDGDTLVFSITQNPQNGALSGLTSLAAAKANINYSPKTNYSGTDQFAFAVLDNDNNRDTSFINIVVQPVNDAPSFMASDEVDVPEDAGAQSILWATNISSGPPDESAQTLAFYVLNNNKPEIFEVQPQISPNGTLTFTPKANAIGVAELSVQLQDNGGTDNGGIDTTQRMTLRIAIQQVNDAPSFAASDEVSVLEDAGNQGVAWASNISPGPMDESGQILSFHILSNSNPDLFEVQPQIAADGTLTFTAKADSNGVATLVVQLQDDGGTANGGIDTTLRRDLLIHVQSVNDAPNFAASDEVSVLEDAGNQGIAWASNISPGPMDESGQILSFHILSNSNPDLFEVQPQIAADGTLTFTAKADSNGVATLVVQLQDDGGTANGGIDTTLRRDLLVTIQQVNDAPSFTKGADISIQTTTTPQSFPDWATAISPGPANESTQQLTFVIESVDIPTLFTEAPQIAPDGTLTFTAAQDAVGIATITVYLMDDGGTANGGADTSATETFTITLTPSGG